MPSRVQMPETLGRYRIVRKVGEGGMGSVYLAEDTFLGRVVALKVPHFDEEDGPGMQERFMREARSAAILIHPDICPVLDAGQVENIFYLTMPFVEGEPLSRHLGGGPWPVDRACVLVRRLALAVGALHERGLVHRDLKPGNVMLRPGGEPMLMDFGLARSYKSHSQRLTASGTVVGTPAYMAPEQVKGELHAISPATDIYALGVILYELLTASLPFEGPPTLVYGQILHADPPRASQRRPGLDLGLEGVCHRAMSKAPAERYSGVADFVVALEPFLPGGPSAVSGSLTMPVASTAAVELHPTADYTGDQVATHPEVAVAQVATATLLPPSPPPSEPSGRKRVPWLAIVALTSTVACGVLVFILLNKHNREPSHEDLFNSLPKLEMKVNFTESGVHLQGPGGAFIGMDAFKDSGVFGAGGSGPPFGGLSGANGNPGSGVIGNVGGGPGNNLGGFPKAPDFPPTVPRP